MSPLNSDLARSPQQNRISALFFSCSSFVSFFLVIISLLSKKPGDIFPRASTAYCPVQIAILKRPQTAGPGKTTHTGWFFNCNRHLYRLLPSFYLLYHYVIDCPHFFNGMFKVPYFGAFVEVEHQTSSLWWLAEIEACLMMAGFKVLAKWLQKSPENLLFLLIVISRILPSNGKRLANNCARVKRSFLVMRTTIKQTPAKWRKSLILRGFCWRA